jgi:hypothetical protein
MSNDDRRNLLFDAGELDNLRREAKINQIDFSRAKIRKAKDGGYVVVFDAPLFHLGDVLRDPPGEVDARTAAIAEGVMLQGLMAIQRAERVRARMGRCYGLSPDQVVRRPLSDSDVADYKAGIAHQAEVKRLQRELTAVLEANAKNTATSAGAADLADRYGLAERTPAKEPEAALALPSAKPQRAPSRRGART